MITFFITLILSFYTYSGIDNNPFIVSKEFGVLHRFEINREQFYVNRNNGFVYQLHKNKWKRIDKSVDLKAYNKSILFKHKDTLYRYGGYGFYSERDHLNYFDLNEKKWYYKNNNGVFPRGIFDGYAFTNQKQAFIYGGKYISKKDGITVIPNNQIFVFDFDSSAFTNIIETSFEFKNKMFLGKFDDYVLFHDTQYLYKIDFSSLEVVQYLKPKSIQRFNNARDFATVNDNHITIHRYIDEISTDNKTINLEYAFLHPLKSFDLKKNHSPLIKVVLILLTLAVLLYIVRLRRSNTTFTLTDTSLKKGNEILILNDKKAKILKTLIQKEKIDSIEVYNIIENKDYSYSHNMRLKNNTIAELDNILKRITGIETKHILSQNSTKDGRNKTFVVNPKIKSIISNLIKVNN